MLLIHDQQGRKVTQWGLKQYVQTADNHSVHWRKSTGQSLLISSASEQFRGGVTEVSGEELEAIGIDRGEHIEAIGGVCEHSSSRKSL